MEEDKDEEDEDDDDDDDVDLSKYELDDEVSALFMFMAINMWSPNDIWPHTLDFSWS